MGNFGSKVEKERYEYLKLLQEKGEIEGLTAHPSYDIVPEGWPIIRYIPDARYIRNGVLTIEDTKGCITDVFNLKKKLFLGKYPKVPFFIIKKRSRKKKPMWEIIDARTNRSLGFQV